VVSPTSAHAAFIAAGYTHASDFPDGLTTVPFRPALHDTFAVITRRAARVSPGVRELITDLEAHMHAVAADFDRSRAEPGNVPHSGD
jgi:hypothetical protein